VKSVKRKYKAVTLGSLSLPQDSELVSRVCTLQKKMNLS